MTGTPADAERRVAAPWIDIANYPAIVMDNRVVNLDGKIYSIAGGNGTASTANNYVYDPATLAWTAIAPLPGARNAVTVGAVDGKIIASSGWGATGPDAGDLVLRPGRQRLDRSGRQPGPACRRRTGRPRRQAVRRRRLHHRELHCRCANTVVATTRRRNSWATLANYPKSVAFASCGAIDGKVYCAGGNDGANWLRRTPTSTTRAPTPGPRSPTAPADHWAGVVRRRRWQAARRRRCPDRRRHQRRLRLRPGRRHLGRAAERQPAPVPRWRGLWLLQGRWLVRWLHRDRRQRGLPGLEDCSESSADVSWLALDKTEATLAPGESRPPSRSASPRLSTSRAPTPAAVTIGENTPYSVDAGRRQDERHAADHLGQDPGHGDRGQQAPAPRAPLPGATVQVDSWAQSYTFTTDAGGKYAYWLDIRNNPLTLIAAKDGYKPQTRSTELLADEPITEDFALLATK